MGYPFFKKQVRPSLYVTLRLIVDCSHHAQLSPCAYSIAGTYCTLCYRFPAPCVSNWSLKLVALKHGPNEYEAGLGLYWRCVGILYNLKVDGK